MGRREFEPGGARDRALSALQALDPGISRDEWVRVGMAAKAAGLEFDDWHRWSATAGNYSGESDCRAVWRSFKPDGESEREHFSMPPPGRDGAQT